MNTAHLTDKLRDLGLQGMAEAAEHQAASPPTPICPSMSD